MDVTSAPILPTEATTSTSTTPQAPGELGRDTFLQLLTTQMQNQDPLNPASNEEFLAQLAQFTSVEQLMGVQQSLDAVYMGIASMNNASMANLLGTEVTAVGNGVHLSGEDDTATLSWEASTSTSATLSIYDEAGSVVRTVDLGTVSAGEGSWTWDGTDNDGNFVGDGDYTFGITAGEGDVTTLIHGVVDEMDFSDGTPRPSVDGVAVEIGDIRMVAEHDDSEGGKKNKGGSDGPEAPEESSGE